MRWERCFLNPWKDDRMLNSISSTDTVKVIIDNRRPKRQEKQPVMPLHEGRTPGDKVSLEENPGEVITYSVSKKTALIDSGFSSLREMLAEILEKQGITHKGQDIADPILRVNYARTTLTQLMNSSYMLS